MIEQTMDADKEVELVERRLTLLRNHVREWKAHVADENNSIQIIQTRFVTAKSELRFGDYIGLAALSAEQSNELFNLNAVNKNKLNLLKQRQHQEFLDFNQQFETDGDKQL